MSDTFKSIPEIRYEGSKSTNPFSFKFYNPDKMINGKSMKEHLKFAMSYWHTMCADASDPFGRGTIDRSYGKSDPMDIAKVKVDEAFDFMNKLQIEYFCFHDTDIAPEGNSLVELKSNLAEITEYISSMQKKYDKKLLWGTANCFSNPTYMHGAGTSCSPDAYACAGTQIKNAIDSTIKLGGAGYVFWGGREGYETLLNTDMGLELDNLANLLKMAVNYARNKGFTGDFYIEPKPKEPTKHQYDFDVSTVIAFLRKYGLDKDFKMNIEANHATLAGHTFQHDLRVARINDVLGSIDANQGDYLLGWDTDQFPTNVYETTMCMYEVLKSGGFTNGGLNFDAKVRRASYKFEDIVFAYISGMDAFALGLENAVKIIEDGRLDNFVSERYSGYDSGIGEKIKSGNCSLEELEEYALGLKEVSLDSGRQEYLESILNNIIFG